MATILLSTYGTFGDIKPFLGLGEELKTRDHRPIFLVNPWEERCFNECGLETRGIGESIHVSAVIEANPRLMGFRGGECVLREHFMPFTEALYPIALRVIEEEKPALAISHFGCFGLTWAAQEQGIPCSIVHLAPVAVVSLQSISDFPLWVRLLAKLFFPLGIAMLENMLRKTAKRVGYAHPNLTSLSLHDGVRLIGLWSKHFRRPASDDPGNVVICGFPTYDDPDLPPEVEDFLAAGEAPIAFGLGTSAVQVAGRFFEHAVDACQRLDKRGILLCNKMIPPELPASILAVPFAPYSKIFPRCAAIVHHGGIGTTAEAMRSGRPMLIVPFAHDQYNNATRIRNLGIGNGLLRSRVNGRRLAAKLRGILTPEISSKAQQTGEAVQSEGNGIIRAADEIVQILTA